MAQTRNYKQMPITLPEPFADLAKVGAQTMPLGSRTVSAFVRGLLMRWAFERQEQGHTLPEDFLALVGETPHPQPKTTAKKNPKKSPART